MEWGGATILIRLMKEVPARKGTFELRPEGGEEVSHEAFRGGALQAEGPAGQRPRGQS